MLAHLSLLAQSLCHFQVDSTAISIFFGKAMCVQIKTQNQHQPAMGYEIWQVEPLVEHICVGGVERVD